MPNIDPKDAQGFVSDKDLKAASAYAEKNNTQPRRPKPQKKQLAPAGALRQELNKAQARVKSLEDRESMRKEATPTFEVGSDTLDMVFQGKIAGKTAVRKESFVTSERMKLLQPILTPIVSVMNAALRAQQLQSRPVSVPGTKKLAQVDGQTVYKATSLDKAAIAYSALLENPDFVQQLTKLNEIIKQTYDNLGVEPGKVKNFTKSSTPGSPARTNFNAWNWDLKEEPNIDQDEFSL